MDLQRIADMAAAACRDTRTQYHLSLGSLIAALERVPPEAPVQFDAGCAPCRPHSYRGYYEDLAFATTTSALTAGKFLATLKDEVLDKPFTGYKGGGFTMGETTPLWVSEYGSASSIAIVGVSMVDGKVVLITKQLEN